VEDVKLKYHILNKTDRTNTNLQHHRTTISAAATEALGDLLVSIEAQRDFFVLTVKSLPRRKLLTDMGKAIVANDPVLDSIKKIYNYHYRNGKPAISTRLFRKFE
jgi:hypothetical protein